MPENISKPNVLAHWRFTAEQWRDFLEYESTIYKGSIRAAKPAGKRWRFKNFKFRG